MKLRETRPHVPEQALLSAARFLCRRCAQRPPTQANMASRPSRASRASAPQYDDGQSNDGSEFEKESSREPGVPSLP